MQRNFSSPSICCCRCWLPLPLMLWRCVFSSFSLQSVYMHLNRIWLRAYCSFTYKNKLAYVIIFKSMFVHASWQYWSVARVKSSTYTHTFSTTKCRTLLKKGKSIWKWKENKRREREEDKNTQSLAQNGKDERYTHTSAHTHISDKVNDFIQVLFVLTLFCIFMRCSRSLSSDISTSAAVHSRYATLFFFNFNKKIV